MLWINNRQLLLLNCFTCYDTRPALLTIKQLTTKQGDEVTYQAVFKQPQVQGRFLNLSVITNCDSTLVNAKTNSSALEETFSLTCAEPLASNSWYRDRTTVNYRRGSDAHLCSDQDRTKTHQAYGLVAGLYRWRGIGLLVYRPKPAGGCRLAGLTQASTPLGKFFLDLVVNFFRQSIVSDAIHGKNHKDTE